MEAGILLFFQSQWRIKGTDLFPSNRIFFLASEVVCGLCFKKTKNKKQENTDLIICSPNSMLQIEGGPLKACSFQVVIQLHSVSVS